MGIVELIPQHVLRRPNRSARAPRHLPVPGVYLPIMGLVRCTIAMADR
jgi:hypothetical protein